MSSLGPIVLLTDFGLRDGYVAAVKGVILQRNPSARLLDLTHAVPPQDVARAAFVLATTAPYFPPGSIFLTVVDPGVGTQRRALALRAADHFFVGPDNGMLAWTLRFLARDGRLAVETRDGELRPRTGLEIVELTERRFWRSEVSATFHARDIFGPVAAELSLGCRLEQLGRPAAALLDLPWPAPCRREDGSIEARVITLDRFGNLITSLRAEDLPAEPTFELVGHEIRGLVPNFQSEQPLVAMLGSSGFVELAMPNGSAAAVLRVGPGAVVRVVGGALPGG